MFIQTLKSSSNSSTVLLHLKKSPNDFYNVLTSSLEFSMYIYYKIYHSQKYAKIVVNGL